MPPVCTLCGVQELHLKFVTFPCCGSVIHSVCIEWMARGYGCKCVDCHTPLPESFIDEVKILQKVVETCTICQEDVVCQEKYLTCSHWFHTDCLVGMIENRDSCPNCQTPITDPTLFVLQTKLHHRKCKAMHDFLNSGICVRMVDWAREEMVSIVEREYVMPDADTVDPQWSDEKILTTFFLENSYQFTREMTFYMRRIIDLIHRCNPTCEGVCLVSTWRSRGMIGTPEVITLD